MVDHDFPLSSNIKRLLLYANDHLAVDDEQRLDFAHEYVVETFEIVVKDFPEHEENPPFDILVDLLRRVIMRHSLWKD